MILTMQILSQQFRLSEWTADSAILHNCRFCGQEGHNTLDAQRACTVQRSGDEFTLINNCGWGKNNGNFFTTKILRADFSKDHITYYLLSKVQVSRNRPRWSKRFRVG